MLGKGDRKENGNSTYNYPYEYKRRDRMIIDENRGHGKCKEFQQI
jgi:hypothetical protein